MPLREYKCTSCDTVVEVLEPLEKPPEKCEECGNPVRALVSAGSFKLKGDGFHKRGWS